MGLLPPRPYRYRQTDCDDHSELELEGRINIAGLLFVGLIMLLGLGETVYLCGRAG